MKFNFVANAAVAALTGLAWLVATPAIAGMEDYEFQLVQKEIKKADGTQITVRLIDKRTGKAVPDAVIFAQRIDMAPDGMESMTSAIAPLPGAEPGLYRFRIDLPMAGDWRLSLAAKLQGETGTLEGKLPFKAVP